MALSPRNNYYSQSLTPRNSNPTSIKRFNFYDTGENDTKEGMWIIGRKKMKTAMNIKQERSEFVFWWVI